MAISDGISETDDDLAIGKVADVKEVDITYTSRMGMWEKVKYFGEGTYIPQRPNETSLPEQGR